MRGVEQLVGTNQPLFESHHTHHTHTHTHTHTHKLTHTHTHTHTQTHTHTHTHTIRAMRLKKSCFFKRKVFKGDLKELTEVEWRTETGSWVQITGAW